MILMVTPPLNKMERKVLADTFSLQQGNACGPCISNLVTYQESFFSSPLSVAEVRILELKIGLALGTLETRKLLQKTTLSGDSNDVWRFTTTENGTEYILAELYNGGLDPEYYEDISDDTEINGYKQPKIPAADRIVSIDHNSAAYQEATEKLDNIIELVEADRSNDFEDKEQRVAELKAGRELLKSHSVSVSRIGAVLRDCLTYLAKKFADVSIGDMAGLAWASIKSLLGF